MAFLVEDGTGLSASNSYATVAEYKAYLDDRGVTYAGLVNSDIEKLLIKATDYIDQRFTFIGQRSGSDQALSWPRDFAYDDLGNTLDPVPTELKYATIEYANRARTTSLWLTPATDTVGIVKTKKTVVGPIEKTTDYISGPSTVQAYPPADHYLDGLITGGVGGQATSFR
jgi:hypothetical protein